MKGIRGIYGWLDMRRLVVLWVFELVVVGFLVCFSVEAQAIKLRGEVTVSSPEVKLGDVVESDVSEYTELFNRVVLCPAPKPGYAVEIPGSMVLARIKQVGIDESTFDVSAESRVVVRRATIVLSKDILAGSLRHYILENMPWDEETTDVQVYPPAEDIVLPEGDVEINWSSSSSSGFVGKGVYRGRISVDGKFYKTIICRANIEAKTLAISASRMIPKGGVIGEKDITYKEVVVGRRSDNLLWDVDSVLGSRAKRSIPAGSLIKATDIELPAVIKKDQIVEVAYSTGV